MHISTQGGQQLQHPFSDKNEKTKIDVNISPFLQSGFRNSLIVSLFIIMMEVTPVFQQKFRKTKKYSGVRLFDC